MDDISDVLDEATSHLGAHSLDVDAMVTRTRAMRRRRQQVESVCAGVVAVVGSSAAVGILAHVGQPGRSPAAALTTAAHPGSPVVGSRTVVAPTATATGPQPLPLRPTPSPTVPQGFEPACGRPGTKLVVRDIPITIPHRICNLSGVNIVTADGIGVVVPTKFGEAAAAVPAGVAGASLPQGIEVTTDKSSGDVTITHP